MRKELFPASLLAATALAAARLAWGQTIPCTPGQPASSNGVFCMAASQISSGGGCTKDSDHPGCTDSVGLRLTSVIGDFNQPLHGGDLKLWTGVVASVAPATADTSAVHAFPTPFIPSKGHTGITFSDLPAQVTIKIYTLSGHLVKTFNKSDPSDRLVWSPVANEQGSTLASGVYIFIVTQAGGGQKKGKIMIIR
jgi:hypothetical protein